nr:SDR family NAD(P)-dependent oxidoreductase [Pseudomonas sp.]
MLSRHQTIVVTGGTSGIGHALVHQLHRQGHRLIVLSRSAQKLAELKANLSAVDVFAVDLSDTETIAAIWRVVVERHPDVSMLINNAAVQFTPRYLDDDFELHSIDLELSVNLAAPLHLSWHALRTFHQRSQPAAIVNVSSGLAFFPKTRSAVYCATKAALHSFSQSLRYQTQGSGVRIVEIILPPVDTPMTAGRGRSKISAEQAAAQIVTGLANDRDEIFVGKARWLPTLQRVAPSLVRQMMKRG